MVIDKIIAIDDGHGEETPGKRTPVFPAGHKYAGQIMKENHFNREVADLLGKHLQRCGFKVLFVAPSNEDTPLKVRTDLANNKIKNMYNRPADLYISIHANALTGEWGNAQGIETFIYSMKDAETVRIGKMIHEAVMKGTPLANRGLKTGNLHVLRETKMKAVLVELGFMDNLREAELLMSQKYREECAEEIAKAICQYYGVPYTPWVNIPSEQKLEEVKTRMVSGTKDVPENGWYADAVKFVIEKKLMSVDQNGHFNPEAPVTRAMLAQVLFNLSKNK